MKNWLIFGVVMILTLFSYASDNVIYLTSLDWPPYTGKNLPNQGASIIVAQKAFAAMGYELKVEFLPWQRAVKEAKDNEKYAGYFPEYYSKDIENDFIFSAPMGEGPLGFVERIDNPIKWNSLSDLTKIKIGVVDGYVNTEEFDKMVANKELQVDVAVDDITNIKKIQKKRIPLAVIDKNVLNYLLSTDPSLKDFKKEIQYNSKDLEIKKLYVCFKKDENGKKYAKIFNEGLKKINVKQIMDDYFKAIK